MKKQINEYTKDLYNNSQTAWPNHDVWHSYTRTVIDSYVNSILASADSNERILNAGAGGSTYNTRSEIWNIDIAENLIHNLPHAIVCSIEDMPIENTFFDKTICVGSVLNYCNAQSAISEISRTLKSKGLLILEFERSSSAQFWFSGKYNQPIHPQWYDYNGQKHLLWLYSEKYIKNLLQIYNLEILDIKRFHTFSAIASRYKKLTTDSILSHIIAYDRLGKPFSSFTAHNAIFLCKKK